MRLLDAAVLRARPFAISAHLRPVPLPDPRGLAAGTRPYRVRRSTRRSSTGAGGSFPEIDKDKALARGEEVALPKVEA